MFAGFEVLQEEASTALRVGEQFAVGPLPSLRGRQALDEGDAVRHFAGDLAQPPADRRALQQRRAAAVGNPM